MSRNKLSFQEYIQINNVKLPPGVDLSNPQPIDLSPNDNAKKTDLNADNSNVGTVNVGIPNADNTNEETLNADNANTDNISWGHGGCMIDAKSSVDNIEAVNALLSLGKIVKMDYKAVSL